MKLFLSVIIPVRNEVKRLPLTLVDIDKHLSKVTFPYEIIVVDGASTDGTPELVEKFKELIANLKLIEIGENLGKGGAVKKGMLEAGGKYRLFTDADNSTSIDQFDNMLPYFKEGYDIVIGSRAVKGARLDPPQPFIRQLLGKAGNLFIQLVVLPGIKDTQAGFKCFTEEAAAKIFPLQRVSGAPPRGWGFDVEILALARRLGFKVKEMPVHWVNDPSSTVTPMAYFGVLWETVKVRYWLARDAYPDLSRAKRAS
ncbi:MAG: glycosyltransferase family 2 protein [Candidatus Colwellbacteria bacterium]|nr:glycosyltransferase family 2 protein [Candidatus Colwellbacteria bacterium]